MKTSTDYPPNYQLIKGFFPDLEAFDPIFCYGETIYNPFGREITPDLVAHETVHSKQQGHDPEAWWTRYGIDPAFRLSQEIPAYHAQYEVIKRNSRDREFLAWYLFQLAKSMSSSLYGNMVSQSEALGLIRKGVV